MTANNLQQSAIVFTKEMARSILECDREFPIDLDDAWQWLGYSTKQKALLFLKSNFEEGEDFLTQRLKNSTGGRPSCSIVLTIECLKCLGMMTGTSQGKQIRKYFLQCEKLAKAAILPTKKRSLCTTAIGLANLGRLIRKQRESMNLNLGHVIDKIQEETGYTWSVASLSKLETGKMPFDPNFIAVILTVLPIPHPQEKRSFTEFEIFEVARENLDPSSGNLLKTSNKLKFDTLNPLPYPAKNRISARYPRLKNKALELRSKGFTFSQIAQYFIDNGEDTLSFKGEWTAAGVSSLIYSRRKTNA